MVTVTNDVDYLIVQKHNESGDACGYAHIQYNHRETTYAFRPTEHDIEIIDRDGACNDDIRLSLEKHYTEEGIAGEITSLKDENGVNF